MLVCPVLSLEGDDEPVAARHRVLDERVLRGFPLRFPLRGLSLGTTSGKKSETINQERLGKISSAQLSIETGQLHYLEYERGSP